MPAFNSSPKGGLNQYMSDQRFDMPEYVSGQGPTRWNAPPGRIKDDWDVRSEFDPTGMRKAASLYSMALNDYNNVYGDNQDNITPLMSATVVDPYSGQLAMGTQSAFRRSPLEGKSNRTGAFAERQVSPLEWIAQQKQGANSDQLSQLAAAEKYASEYNNRFGQWQKDFTNPELMKQLQSSGVDYGNFPNIGSAQSALNQINSSLVGKGITDLNQVGFTLDEKGKPQYFNKVTGERLPDQLMHFKGGDQGTLRVQFQPGPDGSVSLRNRFDAPKMQFMDYVDAAMPAVVLGMATAGAATPALTAMYGGMGMGSTAAGIAGSATAGGLSGAANSALQGGDVGEGFLTGALGGGIGGGVNALNPGGAMFSTPALANIANRTIGATGSAGLTSLIKGTDPSQAMSNAALGSIFSGGLSEVGKNFGLDPRFANQLGGFGSKYLMSELNKPRRG